ncbi:HAMP domain-containing histidine kinase [Paenibacillus athensensis]|uniref:histidine kinase n=1 Tax=Paenibacillus athensensis TaxID=1967502 RepID=A0A4Y8PSW0_9BACL|nr:HAMP domain-containing sensor histidine kinase [Paenibacillus athensensis]MCD1258602.1 HAMP domain-containing histidine kinase [Paenibacillus athensensis]
MPNPTPERSTLLRKWTLRYVVTLCAGLIAIGAVSVLWQREAALHQRLNALQAFGEAAAAHVSDGHGGIVVPDRLYEWIDGTQRQYGIPGQFGFTVFDRDGRRLFYKSAPVEDGAVRQADDAGGALRRQPAAGEQTGGGGQTGGSGAVRQADGRAADGGAGGATRTGPDSGAAPGPAGVDAVFATPPPLLGASSVRTQGRLYAVTVPVASATGVAGTIAISYSKAALTDVHPQYGLIGGLLALAGLLGWLIIYLLLRRVTRPLHEVAAALRQVEQGDYKLALQERPVEREIHALYASCEAMARRLEQLERLRTELLAGVTHDLKTPVTSIHGLIQAVRDEVVSGPEASEFLDISLKETVRLQHMIADLLDFHAFASGRMKLNAEPFDLGKLLKESVYQWGLLHQDDALELHLDLPEAACMARGDADRVQQILVNLLDNGCQALNGHGAITVKLQHDGGADWEVLVSDTGHGIPAHEQPNIFESYFRGESKKLAVRGLGLGLTFSRLLANAMGGRLQLKMSSPLGTTFQIFVPQAGNNAPSNSPS